MSNVTRLLRQIRPGTYQVVVQTDHCRHIPAVLRLEDDAVVVYIQPSGNDPDDAPVVLNAYPAIYDETPRGAVISTARELAIGNFDDETFSWERETAVCGNCGAIPMGRGCYHICHNSPHYYSREQEIADEPFYGDDDNRERYAATIASEQYED